MSRRLKNRHRLRTALPPLHDKEVELVSITKQFMIDCYVVHLLVDGLTYFITKNHCQDELAVLTWLNRLKHKNNGLPR